MAQRLKDREGGGTQKDSAEERDGAPGASQLPGELPPDAAAAEEPKDTRTKFQAYVLRSVQDEAKAVVYWTNNRPGGYASLTELAEEALSREIERMRAEFTGGEPFPPMPPGQRLPTRPSRRNQ